MKIKIKSIFGKIFFEGDFSSISEAVSSAVKGRADLRYANLTYANLTSADLRSADLTSADLRYANLTSADLTSADLRYANLRSADLTSADLRYANLTSADLRYANLTSADLTASQTHKLYAERTILPEGDLIGYKKLSGGVIAKLRIPADAKRVGGMVGRKCRAEFAIVLEGEGRSSHDSAFVYEVGKKVTPTHPFDPCLLDECRSGIHFFITREEAETY